jgi:hypothetical protein
MRLASNYVDLIPKQVTFQLQHFVKPMQTDEPHCIVKHTYIHSHTENSQ